MIHADKSYIQATKQHQDYKHCRLYISHKSLTQKIIGKRRPDIIRHLQSYYAASIILWYFIYMKNVFLVHSIFLNMYLYHYLKAHISVLQTACTHVWLPECGYQCPYVCPHTLWLHECGYQCPSVCPHICMTAWLYVSLSLCLSTHLMTTRTHTSVSSCLSIHLMITRMYMSQCSFVFSLHTSEHMLQTVCSVLQESGALVTLAKIGDEVIWVSCSIMTNLAKRASMIILSPFAY
jgi:hypothetical protein